MSRTKHGAVLLLAAAVVAIGLKSVASYLEPGGRIAVIEFNPNDSPHKEQPELVVSKEQTTRWMAEAGLVVSEDVALFPDKWFVIYARR